MIKLPTNYYVLKYIFMGTILKILSHKYINIIAVGLR